MDCFLLIDDLYPVLEKLGSENAAINQAAVAALQQIANTCSNGSVTELMGVNADYLVNSISLRMRHLSRHPKSPLVLCVILKYSDQSILPLMEDTILEILTSLDAFYEDAALPFMNILYAITKFIGKWFALDELNSEEMKCAERNTGSAKMKTIADVIASLKNHLKQKLIAEGQTDANDDKEAESDSADQAMEEEEEPEVKKELPYHIQKVSQILERCIHLLSVNDSHVRLRTLDTVAEGLRALASHQDVLLPLVHKLWAPLLPRLADAEMLVILKACRLLNVFADVSRDFIRPRVIKDIFPKLILFLNKQHFVSLKAGPVYHHSLGCKVQLAILNDVGLLCALIGAGESQLTAMVNACLPYLSARQPGILQQACIETFKEFIKIEADMVWLLCVNVYNPVDLTPPDKRFHPVKARGSKSSNEYSHNVTIIMEHLQSVESIVS